MKIWVLEGFITRERLEEAIEEAKAMRNAIAEDSEHIEAADMLLSIAKRNLDEHPDGYWLGYQGKLNYKVFCWEAKQTMRNLKDRHMKWRVLKAELPDDAKTWVKRYTNGVENDGVLRYLYATM